MSRKIRATRAMSLFSLKVKYFRRWFSIMFMIFWKVMKIMIKLAATRIIELRGFMGKWLLDTAGEVLWLPRGTF